MTPASDLSVAEYFARFASSYGAGEYYRKRRAVAVAEIGRRLGKIASLLDLGCGNGTYLAGFERPSIRTSWWAPIFRSEWPKRLRGAG
jgi:SAM-dependent methyltransferase